MEKFKYIIIDDEYPVHLSVRNCFKNHQNYLCLGAFYNPIQAMKFIEEQAIDLIILDIEMPEMNGFQFLEILNKNIFVIILTAYPEKYSLDAHKFYIDKDLIVYTNKAQFFHYLPKILTCFEKKHEEKKVFERIKQLSKNEIKSFPKKFRQNEIPLENILFFMVVGHNIVLRLKSEEEEICRMSLYQLLDFLPSSNFLQVNRNTVINTNYITAYTSASVCVMDHHFSISLRKRSMIVPLIRSLRSDLIEN